MVVWFACEAARGLPAPDLFVYLQLNPDVAARRGDYGKERYERLRVSTGKPSARISRPMRFVNAVVPLALEAAAACRQGAKIKTLWDT
eukprot:jgi/Chlat1/1472/Chrsp12S02070